MRFKRLKRLNSNFSSSRRRLTSYVLLRKNCCLRRSVTLTSFQHKQPLSHPPTRESLHLGFERFRPRFPMQPTSLCLHQRRKPIESLQFHLRPVCRKHLHSRWMLTFLKTGSEGYDAPQATAHQTRIGIDAQHLRSQEASPLLRHPSPYAANFALPVKDRPLQNRLKVRKPSFQETVLLPFFCRLFVSTIDCGLRKTVVSFARMRAGHRHLTQHALRT